ncbi:MAG TPA: DUF1648 domain-containing protein [Candidatus Obscuribacterales bacterium]
MNETDNGYNGSKAQMIFGLLVVAQLGLSFWAWGQIPPDKLVPVHWGLSGKPDGFAPKGLALSLVPVIMAVMLPLQSTLQSKFSGEKHKQASVIAYVSSIGPGVFLTIVHGILVFSALGYVMPVTTISGVSVGILLCALGLATRTLPGDSKLSVKTPWARRSETVAQKTNAFGGSMLLLMGLGAILTGATGNMYLFVIVMSAGALAVVAGSYVLSWMLWKNESK